MCSSYSCCGRMSCTCCSTGALGLQLTHQQSSLCVGLIKLGYPGIVMNNVRTVMPLLRLLLLLLLYHDCCGDDVQQLQSCDVGMPANSIDIAVLQEQTAVFHEDAGMHADKYVNQENAGNKQLHTARRLPGQHSICFF